MAQFTRNAGGIAVSMDFYLDRKAQRDLRAKLDQVPSLVEDLSITITRQARVAPRNSMKLHRHKPESKVPFHIAAADAADDLHNTLVAWVRFTCTNRQVRYTSREDTLTLARWLDRNIIGLALCEGSETAYADIAYRIDECRRQVDLPEDNSIIDIDRTRMAHANLQIVTAGQVDKIAFKLGALAEGLNKRRVETLDKGGRLKPCAIDEGVKFYRLGDVLDAHHRHARRTPRNVAGRKVG